MPTLTYLAGDIFKYITAISVEDTHSLSKVVSLKHTRLLISNITICVTETYNLGYRLAM